MIQEAIQRSVPIVSVWPSPQEFNEAVQTPRESFSDLHLCSSQADELLGFPRAVSGAFASVYKMKGKNSCWAVKCFLRRIADQELRYQTRSQFLQIESPTNTIPFTYLSNGIRINGRWFPVLKMEWLEGQTLDEFISSILYQTPEYAFSVAQEFLALHRNLRELGIAHGDLQHGNIIVTPAGLRLVDYDGMFVPGMEGLLATELGHRHYQHPARRTHHFGAYIDNFPAWIIYSSLLILAIDPSLFAKFQGASDYLLFTESDLRHPERSRLFHHLDQHTNSKLVSLSRFLRHQLTKPIDQIIPLQEHPPEVDILSHAESCECSHSIGPSPERWWQNMRLDPRGELRQSRIYDIEPELIQALPRQVNQNWNCRRNDSWLRLWLLPSVIAGVIVALTSFMEVFMADLSWFELYIFIWTTLFVLYEFYKWKTPFYDLGLIRTGSVSVATVTHKDIRTDSINYSFTANGGNYQGNLRLSYSVWPSIGNGEQLTVLYNAKDPQQHCIYRFAYYKAV